MRDEPSDRAGRGRSSHAPTEPHRPRLEDHRGVREQTARMHQAARRAAAFALRLTQLDIAQRHLAGLHRSHFDPHQPRVPAGHPDGGQWTKAGGVGDDRVASDAAGDNEWKPGAAYAMGRAQIFINVGGRLQPLEGGQAVRLLEAQTRAEDALARVHAVEPNWQPKTFHPPQDVEALIRHHLAVAEEARARLREAAPIENAPLVPQIRPTTAQERNAVAREIAQWLVRDQQHVMEGASWLLEYEESITAYLDPPRTLEELRQAVGRPRKGYDIHHIVEQTAAEQDKFPRSMIDGRDNLVRIPRFKHWQINGWFQTRVRELGDMTPREYLRGKDWAERTAIGLGALIKFGVLKP